MSWVDRQGPYTEVDEIWFLREQALTHPDQCRVSCELIMSGARVYPPSVNATAVRVEASRLLSALSPTSLSKSEIC